MSLQILALWAHVFHVSSIMFQSILSILRHIYTFFFIYILIIFRGMGRGVVVGRETLNSNTEAFAILSTIYSKTILAYEGSRFIVVIF